MNDDLVRSLADLDEDKALTLVRRALDSGIAAPEIVEQCRLGVEIVGRRFALGEYFLSDLVMSEEILRAVMEIVEPRIGLCPAGPKEGYPAGRKIVMGTIEGDIHDLGKNLVIYLLRSQGFTVYDLGVDVPPEAFLRKVRETGAGAVGISVLITYCISSVKKVVRLLQEAGYRVPVVIGGYPVDATVMEYTGADFSARDAVCAVDIFKAITTPA